MTAEQRHKSDQPSERYPHLRSRTFRDVHVFDVNGQEVLVRDCEHGVECYKPVGESAHPEEVAAHDGAALIKGVFYRVEKNDGVVRAYHPHTGEGPRLDGKLEDVNAILLEEAENVV